MNPWVVLKFGGTSVSSLERWQTIAERARQCMAANERPLLVCSALSQVSNTLEALLQRAQAGKDCNETVAELRHKHVDLARRLGVDAEVVTSHLDEMEQLARGISLVGEASPRVRARVMALGELMSTRLGAAYLGHIGLGPAWLDARSLLCAIDQDSGNERHYLSALCPSDPDLELQERLGGLSESLAVTQGFIARDRAGDTVLLGRGGSDTSAAYLAAALSAQRLEIWTDVPGMFTANPHHIPAARLLKRLDYDEAQELATTGAKVLHPRCIAPVREAGIPLHIRSTAAPEFPGTNIDADSGAGAPQVKAVLCRDNIALVVMETLGMWQQTGFLADAFACFAAHDLSIDLVATSATNVTVSLDLAANVLHRATIEAVLRDLRRFCQARYVGPTAAVTLVGKRIRAILHRLGPVLERFEDQTVHLVSQAASDLSLTFVVPEEQAPALARSLHGRVFANAGSDPAFGRTWEELGGEAHRLSPPAVWWRTRSADLLAETERGTPCFVYDRQSLDQAVADMEGIGHRRFYAVKANPNRDILQRLAHQGLGFECVSPAEVELVLATVGPLPKERLLFTPNFAPRTEYEAGLAAGATVVLDSAFPLREYPEVFAGAELFLRLDPGRGQGHHPYVVTAGAQSKFGIPPAEVAAVAELAQQHNVTITGLHAHTGSGNRNPDSWRDKAVFLAQMAEIFPTVRVLDLGGGFGVPEQQWQQPLDLERVRETLAEFTRVHPDFELWVEPGRYLVARAGVLLARVNQTKTKDGHDYVGVDAGMNTFIRPALYGAWHDIVNLSRLGEPHRLVADVVGPICETGDILGHSRNLPETHPGDIMLLANAGAYGRAMSSHYNMRAPAREVLLTDD